MRAAGMRLQAIARSLSARGVPTKTGKSSHWTHQTVARIPTRDARVRLPAQGHVVMTNDAGYGRFLTASTVKAASSTLMLAPLGSGSASFFQMRGSGEGCGEVLDLVHRETDVDDVGRAVQRQRVAARVGMVAPYGSGERQWGRSAARIGRGRVPARLRNQTRRVLRAGVHRSVIILPGLSAGVYSFAASWRDGSFLYILPVARFLRCT